MSLSQIAKYSLMGLVFGVLTFSYAHSASQSLQDIAKPLHIDKTKISTSGISSGGFMAHQFHVAHSANIMGAGIVAGGPFYCAEGSIPDAITKCSRFMSLECANLLNIPVLEEFRYLCNAGYEGPKTDADAIAMAAKSFERANMDATSLQIDTTSNITHANVYLFTGTKDEIVPWQVMDAVTHFYVDSDKGNIPSENVYFNRFFRAHHTMVTDNFYHVPDAYVGVCNVSKTTFGDPYIGDCRTEAQQIKSDADCDCEQDGQVCSPTATVEKDCASQPNQENPNLTMWPDPVVCESKVKQGLCGAANDVDLAGAILKHIYGIGGTDHRASLLTPKEIKSAHVSELLNNKLKQFSQTTFIKENLGEDANAWASFADYGYVYVPEACSTGESCALHVAFHGCKQGGEDDFPFGNKFTKFAGYNEWAKENHIVVLYPQVMATSFGLLNPQGCWDWWGYTDEKYETKNGRQIKAVAHMVNVLVHDGNFLGAPNN